MPGHKHEPYQDGSHSIRLPGAVFRVTNADRKLSPVEKGEYSGCKHRPKPVRPFCASTYVSIQATCPDECGFKDDGCYASAGFTGHAIRLLDEQARRLTPDQVTANEAKLIDRAYRTFGWPRDGGRDGFQPRDTRLHVGGEVSSERGARMLAAAVRRALLRGAGRFWTFTTRWVDIPRDAWGPISVLASVQGNVEAAHYAQRLGYAPAIVVDRFATEKRHTLADGRHKVDVIPCPAQTRGTTCVQCRLCLDQDLHGMGVAIGFEAHGTAVRRARGKVSLPLFQERA